MSRSSGILGSRGFWGERSRMSMWSYACVYTWCLDDDRSLSPSVDMTVRCYLTVCAGATTDCNCKSFFHLGSNEGSSNRVQSRKLNSDHVRNSVLRKQFWSLNESSLSRPLPVQLAVASAWCLPAGERVSTWLFLKCLHQFLGLKNCVCLRHNI